MNPLAPPPLVEHTTAAAPALLDVLSPYVGVLVIAFLVSGLATICLIPLALKNGIVDVPDLQRKNHALPVPYLGGVAIFLGFAIATIAVTAFPAVGEFGQGRAGRPMPPFPLSILVGAAVITITGLLDDVITIRARFKVGGQLFAAAALAYENIGVHFVDNAFKVMGLPLKELNAFSVFGSPLGETLIYAGGTMLIALMVLGACNSVNLLDGLDGLASGIVAIAMGGFLVLALLTASRGGGTGGSLLLQLRDPTRIVCCLAAIGAILGFLPFNFRPASIFMGDAGSLLLGYLAAAAILLFSDTGGNSLLLVTAALIIFAVPITDTSLAIIRRKLRGMPLFAPDNQHIHHLLRRSGLSVRQSVLVMYAAGLAFAALGVGMVAAELQWRYILVVFFLLYGCIMATAFKYGSLQHRLDLKQIADGDAAVAPAAPIADEAGPVTVPSAPITDAAAPTAPEAAAEPDPGQPVTRSTRPGG